MSTCLSCYTKSHDAPEDNEWILCFCVKMTGFIFQFRSLTCKEICFQLSAIMCEWIFEFEDNKFYFVIIIALRLRTFFICITTKAIATAVRLARAAVSAVSNKNNLIAVAHCQAIAKLRAYSCHWNSSHEIHKPFGGGPLRITSRIMPQLRKRWGHSLRITIILHISSLLRTTELSLGIF